MPRFSISILGLTVTFRTDADEIRIQAAKELLEQRFGELGSDGSNISKDKLLACLGLSLADDYLESKARLEALEARMAKLMSPDGGNWELGDGLAMVLDLEHPALRWQV